MGIFFEITKSQGAMCRICEQRIENGTLKITASGNKDSGSAHYECIVKAYELKKNEKKVV
jgi:hypothetical protein